MERKEPSLVPEWLKGAAAGATGGVSQFPQSSFHQDGSSGSLHSSKRVAPNAIADSSPHAFPERAVHPSSRRPGTGDGLLEHSAERFPRPKSSFVSSRSSFHHGNGLDLDTQSNHEWNHEKFRLQRERSKDIALDSAGNHKKEKDQYCSESSSLRRQSTEKHIRYAADVPIRRMNSMVKLSKNESSSHPITGSGLASNMQKAVFEQNFPSLNAQERLAAVHSSLGNVYVLNSSLLEEPSSRTDGISSKVRVAYWDKVPYNDMDVGSSGMSDEPTKSSDSIQNNVLSADLAASISQPMLSSTHVLKPAKLAGGTRQLEEIALKQLKQLVPKKPVFSKLMEVEPVMVTSCITQASSQAFNATTLCPELSKPTDENLVAEKNSREAVVSSAPLAKLEGGTFVPLPASSSTNAAMVKKGVSRKNGMNAGFSFLKKPKQLLDRRAVPIASVTLTGAEGGTSQQFKEGSSTGNGRRISVQAKNRSEFFNALRRKAAGGGTALSTSDNKNSMVGDKIEEVCARDELEDDNVPEEGNLQGSAPTVDGIEVPKSSSNLSIAGNFSGTKREFPANGLILEGSQAIVKESTADDLSLGTLQVSGDAGSEEEETAFLRSLGWQENTKEGEEALTEEEINAFYKEVHMTSPVLIWQKQRLKTLSGKSLVASVGSISPGLSSSDSDSEEELNILHR
ncbi:hypothetical protein O6H91_Y036000 [Diphasiastrum complanatum]|nr:hypothetical protein O6H91_Y036000 [Diphasiastrum complanatum]